MASNYTKTVWTNGYGQSRNATNLNKQEQGIADAQDGVKIKQWYELEPDTNAFTDAKKANVANAVTALIDHEDRIVVLEGDVPFTPFYAFTELSNVAVTSDTYVQVNELTTDILPAGTYELKNTMVSNYDTNTRSGFCRLSFDGGINWLEYNYEPKDTTDIHVNTCGRPLVLATDGIISIIIQARCEDVADTLTFITGNTILERKL